MSHITRSMAERLENRQLLSATIYLGKHDVLHVISDNSGSVISVGYTDLAGTTVGVKVNGVEQATTHTNVKGIVIDAGKGNDNLSIDESVHAMNIDTMIVGGPGSDTLTGGSENDVILGGRGDQVISGGAGINLLVGGPTGDDTLTGGSGTDVILGGGSDATIFGGSGSEYIFGGHGHSVITAGSGDDLIFGGHNGDTINAGAGNDTIFGLAGDDAINASSSASAQATFYLGNGDTLNGGAGSELINIAGGSTVTVNPGTGVETIRHISWAHIFLHLDADIVARRLARTLNRLI